jgi:hypothetical protein
MDTRRTRRLSRPAHLATSRNARALFLAAAAGCAMAQGASGQAVTTGFTYQGELQNGLAPADGAYDLRFRLYDALSGGSQLGSTLCVDNVQVAGGKFSVLLDFGAQFAGQQRFLDIQVRQDTGLNCSNTTGYSLLTPRQAMTATPYATYAPSAGTATTAANATQLNGQSASFYQDAGNLTSGTIADGRMASNVVRTNFSNSFTGTNVFTGFTTFSGAIQSTNPASVYVGDGAALSGLWRLGGNAGTNPATQFIGTSDNQPLAFRVNNQPALRFTPAGVPGTTFSPNILAGSPANTIDNALCTGAAIHAGGDTTYPNRIAGASSQAVIGGGINNSINPGYFATIAGGNNNTITNEGAFIGGGLQNIAGGQHSTVSGGWSNTASGQWAGVVSGVSNNASGQASIITGGGWNIAPGSGGAVLGGQFNTAGGYTSSVLGGTSNTANGAYSTSGGLRAKALHDGSFVWGGATDADFESTAPSQFLVRATNGVGINTNSPGARLNVFGSLPGVNIFTGDLAPFGSAGIESNFSNAGLAGNAVMFLAVDGQERFSVRGEGEAVVNSATGVFGVLDPQGATTGRPELRMYGGLAVDKVGVSVEAANTYAIVNLDNNFRLQDRATDAPSGAVRIDGRPLGGIQLFQFWHRPGSSTTESLAASLTSGGNFTAAGTITGTAKFFEIDHPTDPANKTLRHACIESDEYKNIYDGVATTDGAGYATITLPSWMTDLNENFRYQLTVIDENDSGDPLMWARIVRKIDATNTFMIRTSGAGMEVSWQVTGARKDAWARANPFTPEADKVGTEKGRYLTPEAFGRPASEGLNAGEAFEARAAAAAANAPARTVPTQADPNAH